MITRRSHKPYVGKKSKIYGVDYLTSWWTRHWFHCWPNHSTNHAIVPLLTPSFYQSRYCSIADAIILPITPLFHCWRHHSTNHAIVPLLMPSFVCWGQIRWLWKNNSFSTVSITLSSLKSLGRLDYFCANLVYYFPYKRELRFQWFSIEGWSITCQPRFWQVQ